jgi:hypothetical protein
LNVTVLAEAAERGDGRARGERQRPVAACAASANAGPGSKAARRVPGKREREALRPGVEVVLQSRAGMGILIVRLEDALDIALALRRNPRRLGARHDEQENRRRAERKEPPRMAHRHAEPALVWLHHIRARRSARLE